MAKRLFIAATIPEKVRQFLVKAESCFREGLDGNLVKWVEKENLHQTMVFLGKVREKKISTVIDILNDLSPNPVLDLCLKRIGFFPDQRRPRIVLAEVGGEIAKLSSYYHQMRMALQRAGFKFDTRFSPHISLGRVRLNKGKAFFSKMLCEKVNEMLRSEEVCFKTEKIVLFQSQLTPGGPIYTPISQVKLTAPHGV